MNQRFGNQGSFSKLDGLIRGCVALMFAVAGSSCLGLVAGAEQEQNFSVFAEWCLNKDRISEEARHTVEVLLRDAKTSDCVDLRGADLIGVDLRGVDLSGANLSGAILFYADLSRTNLSGANLENADLEGVDLRKANLRNTNLKNANLTDADLREANLSGANLDGANFKNVFSLCGTTMPNGSISDLRCFPKILYNQTDTGLYRMDVPGD